MNLGEGLDGLQHKSTLNLIAQLSIDVVQLMIQSYNANFLKLLLSFLNRSEELVAFFVDFQASVCGMFQFAF